MKRRLIAACAAAAMAIGALAVSTFATAAGAGTPVSGAAFSTVNENADGTGHCKNGNPNVNCNIYDGKQYVWLNGGPSVAYVGDGDYFFAVLDPGGQADPNDGSPKNLSSPNDAYTNRTFSVAGGTVSYSGSHDFDANKIRLLPYDDTSNPGGVYILAICSLADGYPVTASACKYDAFKVKEDNSTVSPAADPSISKDANGAYDNSYTWGITKTVDKTLVKKIGGNATFNYTVTVTHDGGTVSDVRVTGTISVFNPNVDDSFNLLPITGADVTDTLSDGTVCDVTGGTGVTLSALQTDFAYSCDLTALPQGELDNTATVAWSDQTLDNGASLAAGTADFTFPNIAFDENEIDECVAVNDTYAGSLGLVCLSDPNPKAFTYSRTVAVPAHDCVSYDNTGTFTTNDTGATDSASQTVTVCGPAKTGALTIGFWKNTNGQGLITTYCQNPALANYLKGLGGGSGPFANAPTTSCKNLASYVSSILTGATATDMNNMLKAQMLASALDVWFSGPGWTATTLSKVKPPSNFLSHNSLGTFKMDTTAVCPMVDSTTTGTATCKNNQPSTDAAASGAVPSSPMSMQAILDYASTTPAPFNGSTSSSVWYAANRTKQEILKNIFDQFNNGDAFGSF